MSEEEAKEHELRDKINKIAIEIEKIEETAKKKDAYIGNKINEEFNPKISAIGLKLQNQQAIFDELVSNINDLISKKKELAQIIKNLEHEYNALKKAKEKALNENIKAIAKEKKSKTKVIDRDIKLLERELKTAKSK
ncbi:MAG: hypothetical protein ACW96X_10020 [Promethearchaeota archaeon]|jgi:uncharacterized phage infection (PIP) family protein YhgE